MVHLEETKFLSCHCRCSPAVVPWKRNLREDRFMAASVARKGLPHFTGASFNGRTAFLYSAYIRSIRIAPTIGSVQAALPELFSPFWQSGKTLDGPDRRAHGAHSLGAGPQEPRAGRCNSVRPTRRKRDKPCGNRPARIAAARNARKPVHTKNHVTAGRDRWQPGKTGLQSDGGRVAPG